MRVITGTARGRNLQAPDGQAVRPTSAMVKEAIFSIIQFEVAGARVLDLFAGSGQMGIEALSRGARECVFVDNSRESLGALRENLKSTGPWKNAKVVAGTVQSFLRGLGGEPFDIVFLDPPYSDELLEECLSLLSGHVLEGGVILCEAGAGTNPPEKVSSFFLKKSYKYGRTHVFHYRVIDDFATEEEV